MKKIILWGTGHCGELAYVLCERLEDYHVVAWCDKDIPESVNFNSQLLA